MTIETSPNSHHVLLSAEQIQKRVSEIGRQLSGDYAGKVLYAVCVLEDGFIFMADLVRAIEVPVVCQFIKPEISEQWQGTLASTQIMFTPEVEVAGKDVVLVQALMETGQTSDFLVRNLTARGAASVKLVALLDKQSSRRLALQPDYFGFLFDEAYVIGYGLGAPDLGRNLPYIAVKSRDGREEHLPAPNPAP